MSKITQGDLFAPPAEEARPVAGYAEIVFDRPFDHVYTYAVPQTLECGDRRRQKGRCTFGRGDQPAIGYCVGLNRDRRRRERSRKSRRCSTIRPLSRPIY